MPILKSWDKLVSHVHNLGLPCGNQVRIIVHKPGQCVNKYLSLRSHLVLRVLIPKDQAGEEEKVWDVTIRAPSGTARNLVIRSAEDKTDKITSQQPS